MLEEMATTETVDAKLCDERGSVDLFASCDLSAQALFSMHDDDASTAVGDCDDVSDASGESDDLDDLDRIMKSDS